MTSSNSLHANDIIRLICKLGSKAKIFMQITKTSTNNVRITQCTHWPAGTSRGDGYDSSGDDSDDHGGGGGGRRRGTRSVTRQGVVTFRLNRKKNRYPRIVPAGGGEERSMRSAYERRTLRERLNEPRDLKLEWYFVASTFDKFFFIIFLTAMLLTVLFTLVIVPYWHRND